MNYSQAIRFLYDRLPMYQRIGQAAFKKGLDNILALCNHLGSPQSSFDSVHIAGTNGKGSSAHMLAAILQSAGYKTGLYTSPHLSSFTERIKINGRQIGEDDVATFVKNNETIIEQIKPSFFEITVAMAFDHFAKYAVDIAVVEVGLGGRLDSTNVIKPLASLITNISYDHTQFLGDTLPQIAHEKAGIIKPGVPVVVSERSSEVDPVFIEVAENQGSRLTFAVDEWEVRVDGSHAVELLPVKYGDAFRFSVAEFTPGYFFKNLLGVLSTVNTLSEQFHITTAAIVGGIENFQSLTGFRGRWEVLNNAPLTICDTAHNIAGIKAVINEMARLEFDKLHIVWGQVNDKNPTDLLKCLPRNAQFYFCQAKIPRAMPVNDLIEIANSLRLQGSAFASVTEAFQNATASAGLKDMVFVGGSTFVVAEAVGFKESA